MWDIAVAEGTVSTAKRLNDDGEGVLCALLVRISSDLHVFSGL